MHLKLFLTNEAFLFITFINKKFFEAETCFLPLFLRIHLYHVFFYSW